MTSMLFKFKITKEVDGKLEEKWITRELPIYINKAVPSDHRMIN